MLDAHRPDLPLVSIVMPVYNGANYLADALDSALGQTWPNVEVIVVDDGSDDGGVTARICARYENRIRYFYKVNGGVATALNYGIQVMRGDYFSWLSHDDTYTPDRIVTMLDAHRRLQAASPSGKPLITFSNSETIDENGARMRSVPRAYPPGTGGVKAITESSINGCSLLIPRQCFELAGLFHPSLPTTQDSDMWQRMLRVARIEHVPVVTVGSRKHLEQGSRAPWHWLEGSINKLRVLDRLDSGQIPDPTTDLAGRYRQMAEAGSFRTRTGVICNIRRRLERLLRERSVSLLHVGGEARRPIAPGLLHKMRQQGYRITIAEISGNDPRDVVNACRTLDTDLVWLWDKPLNKPRKTLAGMMDCLAMHPEALGCLHGSGQRKSATVLGPFHGALLSVRAVRDVPGLDSNNGWTAVAHALTRQGGLCRYPCAAATNTDDATRDADAGSDGTPGFLIGTRQYASPKWTTALRAYRVQPGNTARHCAGRIVDALASLAAAPRGLAWPPCPTPMNTLIATLGRYRPVIDLINRAVWRLSSCREVARQRLLRLHGLAGHFDAQWYSRAYPDIRASKMDPLLHFLRVGMVACRDPSPGFDARAYLSDHPDVAAGGWHPIQHYALWGRFEGRRVARSSRAEMLGPPRELAKRVRRQPAVLLVYHAASRHAERVTNNLASQLRRSIRVAIIRIEADERCHVTDMDADESQPATPVAVPDAALLVQDFDARRALIVSSPSAMEDYGRVAESLKLPFDIIHLGNTKHIERAMHSGEGKRFLSGAARHYAFSADTQQALRRVAKRRELSLVPLPDPGRLGHIRPWSRSARPGECCRVALFGDLADEDDFQRVTAVLKIAHRFNLPFVFTLYGSPGGDIPKRLRSRIDAVPVDDDAQLVHSVCLFNPHIAWIPHREPANAIFPLADAAMAELPIVASASDDARSYLAGRPLTWLLPPAAGPRRWLDMLRRAHRTRRRDQWTPHHPLEGFDSRDSMLSQRILHSLSQA